MINKQTLSILQTQHNTERIEQLGQESHIPDSETTILHNIEAYKNTAVMSDLLSIVDFHEQREEHKPYDSTSMYGQITEMFCFYQNYILNQNYSAPIPPAVTKLGFEREPRSEIFQKMFGPAGRREAKLIGRTTESLYNLYEQKYLIFNNLAINRYYMHLDNIDLGNTKELLKRAQLQNDINTRKKIIDADISTLDNYMCDGMQTEEFSHYDRLIIQKQALLIADCRNPNISKLIFDIFTQPNMDVDRCIKTYPEIAFHVSMRDFVEMTNYRDLIGIKFGKLPHKKIHKLAQTIRSIH